MLSVTLKVLASVFLLLAVGCATTPGAGGPTALPVSSDRIKDLDRALEGEKDAEKISVLLYERGHAYLDDAEQLRVSRRVAEGMNAGGVEYATLILGALRDFEAVVSEFPASAEAPEALFHLGAIYDYPNIASFGPALRYYKRTVEEYPNTESARKAEQAIRKIEDNVKQVVGGAHGERK